MIKTKIKKAIALASIIGITVSNLGVTYATNIGTAGVDGDPTFDSNVVWDDNFPGTATGSVTGIVVKASILPSLNMTISASEIDLGTLVAGTPSSGTLDIEVGTNAANGVTITARSTKGGLENTADPSIVLNDTNSNSYTFGSAFNVIDSTVAGFASTGNLATLEVNNNITEHLIYQTNKPEKFDNVNKDVTFTVSANVNAETAAGEYEDIITFTVTGNF